MATRLFKTVETKNGRFRIQWGLWIFIVLIQVCTVSLLAWSLLENRNDISQDAEKQSANTAQLIAVDIASTIDKVHITLDTVLEEIHRQNNDGPINDVALESYFRRRITGFSDLFGLSLFDANGTMVHHASESNSRKVSIADSAFFQHLRDQPVRGDYMFGPLETKAESIRIIGFARRINNPDGSFGGVLCATLKLSRFESMFAESHIGDQGSISIIDQNLAVLVRYPQLAAANAQGKSPQAIGEGVRRFIQKETAASSFIAISVFDGVERMQSIRQVETYPLYVVVGMATEGYLAKWKQITLSIGLLTTFFIATSIIIGIKLNVNWVHRQNLLKEIEQKQKMFESYAGMSSDWYWSLDEHFRFMDISEEDARKMGLHPETLNGKARWEIALDSQDEKMREHKALLESHRPFKDFEYWFIDRNGEHRCARVSGEPVFDDKGSFIGYRGVGKDITQKRVYEERIEQMALYDTLTQLPNRTLFFDRLEYALSIARREQREFAILYFDLDRFKPVNDKYGHDAGDQLLRMVATRAKFLLRETDTIARLGGDEFAVLLPLIVSRMDAEEVGQRIIVALTSPYVLDGIEEKISVGVSIGISLYPKDSSQGDGLVKCADAAMYRAKASGNAYCFCDGLPSQKLPPTISD